MGRYYCKTCGDTGKKALIPLRLVTFGAYVPHCPKCDGILYVDIQKVNSSTGGKIK